MTLGAWLVVVVQYLTSNFSDFQLASLGSFVIHESVFFLAGLPYLMMECWGLQKYKIQVKALLPDSVFDKWDIQSENKLDSDRPLMEIEVSEWGQLNLTDCNQWTENSAIMKNWGRVGSSKCNMRQSLPSLNSEDPEVCNEHRRNASEYRASVFKKPSINTACVIFLGSIWDCTFWQGWMFCFWTQHLKSVSDVLYLLMAKELFLLDSTELFFLLSLLKLALYVGCVEEGEYTSCTGKMCITATSLSHLCESTPHDLFLPCVQVHGIHQSTALTILVSLCHGGTCYALWCEGLASKGKHDMSHFWGNQNCYNVCKNWRLGVKGHAGRWCPFRSYHILSWRISYFIGATASCTLSGSTSMFTVFTMSMYYVPLFSLLCGHTFLNIAVVFLWIVVS